LGNKKFLYICPFIVFRSSSLACQASLFIGFFVSLINNTNSEDGSSMKTFSEDVKIGMAILTFLPLGLGSIIGPLIMGSI
jgi:hypothetical protein